jgi:hypothetical protein
MGAGSGYSATFVLRLHCSKHWLSQVGPMVLREELGRGGCTLLLVGLSNTLPFFQVPFSLLEVSQPLPARSLARTSLKPWTHLLTLGTSAPVCKVL